MEEAISFQTLWEAIQTIKTDMLTHFDSKMDPIQSSLCNIKSSLNTLGEQVSELKTMFRISSPRLQQLEKENAYLVDKVEDLENRSRSSNLRFIRVPESADGRNILSFMSRLIPELLGPEHFPRAAGH